MGYDATARERRSDTADDYRGAFGRDRDRVLYSSAFRRLAGKTQVVAVGELGDFHTRMTHSLKVAQVGRRLAQALQRAAVDAGVSSPEDEYPIPDPELIEAACLAHDLGHPPFGHAGESALMQAVDDVAKKMLCGDSTPTAEENAEAKAVGGFEGNAQTFRICVRLAARHPAHSKGLDLTRATLDGTIKYPWWRGIEGKPAKKWNAYPQDAESVDWVRGTAWGPDTAPSFEADVMDWCDDVTYACHDVEDFFRAGLIPLDRLFAFPTRRGRRDLDDDDEPDEARGFFDFVESKWGAQKRPFDRAEVREAWGALGQLILISAPYAHDRASKIAMHRSTSALITYFVAEFGWRGMPYRNEGRLVVPGDRRLRCDLLQELIFYYVIERPALASQQIGQMRIVRDLLSIVVSEGEGMLPPDRQEELDEGQPLLRVAADHVASLTEPTALALYGRLTGIRPGLVSDPVWTA